MAGIVPLKSPKYILQHVKFVSGAEFATGDDGPALFATDLELAIRRLVGGVRVMEPGEMILSPVQLQPIFAKAKCEDLSLYVDGDTIRIRGPKVKYDLQSYDPNSFPDPPQFTSTNYHVVAANNLRKLIRRTQYATCEDTTRYALGGVLTELRPDSIVMVGADGRRLSEAKASAEVVGDPDRFINMAEGEDKQAPVLSLKFMNLLMKTIKDNDPPIHIAVKAQSSVMARTERATIYGRLIEGRFPDYLDMFASSYDAKISLNVGEFRAAIEQAAITRNAETKGSISRSRPEN
ncbi:DNA polymerase III subunit beta [Singulisphaera sp. Ch08]|uniref:Beta sliding clamp n=1 Tax=Singulisphaera sp. Ch08 TaxID=3120278 RepID=A0AAU7CJK8_9BACT